MFPSLIQLRVSAETRQDKTVAISKDLPIRTTTVGALYSRDAPFGGAMLVDDEQSRTLVNIFYEFIRPIMPYFHVRGDTSHIFAIERMVDRARQESDRSATHTAFTPKPPVAVPSHAFFNWNHYNALRRLQEQGLEQAARYASKIFLCNTNVDQNEDLRVRSLWDVYNDVNNAEDDRESEPLPVTGGNGYVNDEWVIVSQQCMDWMNQMLKHDDPLRHTAEEFMSEHAKLLANAAQLGVTYTAWSWVRTMHPNTPVQRLYLQLLRSSDRTMKLDIKTGIETLVTTQTTTYDWTDTRSAVLQYIVGLR